MYGLVSTLHPCQHLLSFHVRAHPHIGFDDLLRWPRLEIRQQNVQERLDFDKRKSHPYARLARNSQLGSFAP